MCRASYEYIKSKNNNKGKVVFLNIGETPISHYANICNVECICISEKNIGNGEGFAFALIQLSKAIRNSVPEMILAGVLMKSERLEKLSSEGFFPMIPNEEGVACIRLDICLGNQEFLEESLGLVDLIVSKPSDFIVDIDFTDNRSFIYTDDFRLFYETLSRLQIKELDSREEMNAVFDRQLMCEKMDVICTALRHKHAMPIRAPAWQYVDSYENAARQVQCVEWNNGIEIDFPCIIKPRLGCGPSKAHQMALVFRSEGFDETQVPSPGIIQEYINHGGMIWKIYVAGNSVFYERRKSTPDVKMQDIVDEDTPSCIEFDSLRSLPSALPWARSSSSSAIKHRKESQSILTEDFISRMAMAVKEHINLNLFGFDIAFDHRAGEAVIVDINYFPSFGKVEGASSAFLSVLHSACQQSDKTV